jgi:hypothetical protein
MDVTNKMSLAEWHKCVAEFRQFGYDPRNTEGCYLIWWKFQPQ